jgi:RNAse (barnase) inhibitor barstar
VLKNIENLIDNLENNLTLKKDYTTELQELDNLDSTISVMLTMNCDRIKANHLKNRIQHITNWMREEMGRK